MKYFIIILLFFTSCTQSKKKPLVVKETEQPVNIKNSELVYICNSMYATKYHYNDTCEGLENCTHGLEQISKQEAEENGFHCVVMNSNC